MSIAKIIISVVVLIVSSSAITLANERILINHPESHGDARYEYPKNLLKRILAVTNEDYPHTMIETNGLSMNRKRALRALIEGKQLHVMAEATKPEWNEKLLCVRIPIRKGIQGYRLFLTKNEHKPKLAAINSLEEFKSLATGSGADWSTTRVLEEAGFNVVRGVDYEGMFGMLTRNRFLTFGRGINEIFTEFAERRTELPDLVIDDRFVLYIPLPTYFFVTPTKPELKARIETGLLRLIDSGEFDTIFNAEFQTLIQQAQLDKRIQFSIPNPNLTDADPLEEQRFWYKPNRKAKLKD